MAIVIGLTGLCGVGKSTVANKLANLGCEVIDADVLAKICLYNHAKKHFHPTEHKWMKDGKLQLDIVAKEVFADYDAYLELIGWLWPETQEMMQARVYDSDSDYIVYDASMLFEAEAHLKCDLTIVVTSEDETAKARAMQRSGWTEEQYCSRTKEQMPQKDKAALATFRLHNPESCTKEQLELATERLFNELVVKREPLWRQLRRGLGSSIMNLDEAWWYANLWWHGDAIEHFDAFEPVRRHLDQEGRFYHTSSHIQRMLRQYANACTVKSAYMDPRVVGWILTHDLIYVPGADNNESQSLVGLRQLLRCTHAYNEADNVDQVAIESTAHHLPITKSELPYMERELVHMLHDLDLEILAAPRDEYDRYREGVYAEYHGVYKGDQAFYHLWLKGRSEFLLKTIGRPHVFKTIVFRRLYEDHAVANMKYELANLMTSNMDCGIKD